mmetsp:Transcript_77540/g.179744  ORF Transcript_77540/g.179744 Transcript_77540/m.179744 type:complete len:298 (+) Transcript_77540:115-1008(+)
MFAAIARPRSAADGRTRGKHGCGLGRLAAVVATLTCDTLTAAAMTGGARGSRRAFRSSCRSQPPSQFRRFFPSATPLSAADMQVIRERHIFMQRNCSAVAAGRRCRYGWPQAQVYDPFWPSGKLSDVVRLTCPLLVEAIDIYEREGAIARYNAVWGDELRRVNSAHRNLRKQLLEGRGEQLEAARRLMTSQVVDFWMRGGLTSMSINSSDVKCLHAQVADELTSGSNGIGKQVLQDLAERGVEVLGTSTCCDQCDMSTPLGEGRWSFRNGKNKLGRRLRNLRRRQDKAGATSSGEKL